MTDTVHLYLFEGYADWEPSFVAAAINQPQFQREPGRWRVQTVAASRHAMVRSMGGLAVLPDLALDDLQPSMSRMLILPGGEGWDTEGGHQIAIDKATEFLDGGVPVAAICGATAGLARAGWLDHRPHTSNALAYLKGCPGYAGAAHYVDQPAVRDGGLITAGGMAPLEFAQAIFEELRIYDDEVLEAWYQLYKTGKSEYFARMLRAAEPVPLD